MDRCLLTRSIAFAISVHQTKPGQAETTGSGTCYRDTVPTRNPSPQGSIHDGDEVITTPFSFIASSCILYERAKPVCVNIEWDTANIDLDLIEAAVTPRTKAIFPVDAFGQPAKLDVIRQIADRHGLFVIEDSCESLGSECIGYDGRGRHGRD